MRFPGSDTCNQIFTYSSVQRDAEHGQFSLQLCTLLPTTKNSLSSSSSLVGGVFTLRPLLAPPPCARMWCYWAGEVWTHTWSELFYFFLPHFGLKCVKDMVCQNDVDIFEEYDLEDLENHSPRPERFPASFVVQACIETLSVHWIHVGIIAFLSQLLDYYKESRWKWLVRELGTFQERLVCVCVCV